MEKSWIEKAIEFECTPPDLRGKTATKLQEELGIAPSTYYYELAKPENQKKIFERVLRLAKRHTPEILDNLGERAKKDNKATEIFLNYILKIAENLDITTKGKELYDTSQIKAIAERIVRDGEGSSEEKLD